MIKLLAFFLGTVVLTATAIDNNKPHFVTASEVYGRKVMMEYDSTNNGVEKLYTGFAAGIVNNLYAFGEYIPTVSGCVVLYNHYSEERCNKDFFVLTADIQQIQRQQFDFTKTPCDIKSQGSPVKVGEVMLVMYKQHPAARKLIGSWDMQTDYFFAFNVYANPVVEIAIPNFSKDGAKDFDKLAFEVLCFKPLSLT